MSLAGRLTGAVGGADRSTRRWRRALRGLSNAVLALVVTVTVAAAAYDVASSRVLPVPPLDAHGHTVRASGLTTHYEQWGSTGRPVVLVHGFMESAGVWSRLGPMLGVKDDR